MPPPDDLFALFWRPFEDLGVPYIVTGSVASLAYGEPRLTHDIDLVLALRDADVARLETAFPAEEFYCPPVEVVRVELRRHERGHFNLIHHRTGFKADVYLKGTSALHDWAFANRRRSGPAADGFWLAPPEYVIVRKLEYYREGGSAKHVRDIRAMLETLEPGQLDREGLEQWIARRGLERVWEEVATD